MRWMNKHYIWNVIGWLVIVMLAVITIPNMSKLVADKGQITVPSNYQSTRATNMQKQWGRSQRGTTAVVVVFNNGDSALTQTQNEHIDQTVQRIKNHADQYQIRSITAASDSSTAASQLISKDKSTQLLQLNVHQTSSHSITKIRSQITQLAKTSGVTTYVTGADVLNQDFSDATQAGVQKTEIIAAIFIFLVLWFVFRSPVTPLFSLLTVAVSVITSVSVVANLVDRFNFPFSNFTEVFIVIVLFGIGTDYNILLYNEFRERLANGKDRYTATREAIRIGGRTVLYSGLSVLIGMSVLGFANFSLYRSAVGIAVGVVVLLAVLLTLNPFFMAICGPHMFWPVKKFQGEGDSRLWHGMAKHAMIRPVITLIITGIIFIPLALTSHGTLDYDNLVEIGDNVPAKQGFKVVQKHFSKGTAEPTTIYIQSNHKLDNEKSLMLIDRLTKQLQQSDGVKTVASVTQPGGKAIKALYVRNQMSTVTGGLVKAQQGVNKINKGLKSAHSQLASQNVSGAVSGANKLASGASQVSSGANKLNNGTQKVASGASQVSSGAGKLNSGSQSLSSGAESLSDGTQTLQSGISQVTAGLNQLNTKVSSASGGKQAAELAQLEAALPQLNAAIQQLNTQVAGSSTGSTSGVTSSLTTIGNQTKDIATQLQNIKNSVGTVNSVSMSEVEAAFTSAGAPLSAAQKQVMSGVLAKQTAAQKQLTSTLNSSLAKIGSDASAIGNADKTVASQLQSLQSSTSTLQTAVATLAQKANVVLPGAATALQAASSQSSQLSSATGQLSSAMNTINGRIPQLVTGASVLAAGTNKLASSTGQLASGASQVANGSNQLAASTGQLASGARQVASGNQTMATQLAATSKELAALKSGLGTATNGLSSVSTGMGSANGYLKGLQKSAAAKTFYIPSKQLHSASFAPALKTYLSPNKKLTKLTVVLDDDPSSAAAMARLPKLEKVVSGSLKGTSLGNAQVAFGGNTSQTNDINEMASGDFTRTVIIMLAGIFIALMVVTRSLVQPIVIEGILVVAYSGALTLVHWLVKPVLGTDMLTWNTPFFTFVMLISLGVDYSIFLMRKYREYLHEPGATSDKMLQAATVIGTVVISAGIILSGTFAALMPSGVMTLIQIALAVILGIVLLIILLPIVMPAVMKITYPYPYSGIARNADEQRTPKHSREE
ncbi:MMPL family transporter [Levilactobacillus namurensis]|uniref:MMPL family transporter n=1 Tax=Levilactobacillus namurensis TaxID=380393 RepID=UPI0004648207|nr:MMPL family transporter [Levilactobacillus namurensis]